MFKACYTKADRIESKIHWLSYRRSGAGDGSKERRVEWVSLRTRGRVPEHSVLLPLVVIIWPWL